MAVWASSMSIPSCGAPFSCPLILSPQGQEQSSPWICSPNPTFQHPIPISTDKYIFQARSHRSVAWTICVCLTLSSCLPQTSCCSLLWQSPKFPFCPIWSPYCWGSFSACRTIPLLQPSLFFHLTLLFGDCFCPFRYPSSSASAQVVICENGSICRYILDEFVGTDDLHTFLLLHYLDFCKIAGFFLI